MSDSSLPETWALNPQGSASGMTCRASIATTTDGTGPNGRTRSRIDGLRRQAPLVPRPTGASGFEPFVDGDPDIARVALTTAAAGPLGGDNYIFDVHVGAGSTLLLREVSATLVLPGAHGDPSLMHCRVTVESGGTLIWVPEPVIAAQGCHHTHRVDIDLAEDARLFFREELLLGRHGEDPGNLSSRLNVRRGGRPLSIQRFDLGPAGKGFDTPSVVGGSLGVGSVVIVEPDGGLPTTTVIADPRSALLPIDETCVQVNSLGDDGLALRRRLDAALTELGEPWGRETGWSAVPR
ncbi:urease accessory protein UreD [Brevibacterium sp. CFH 10365]|uniref:urease accessory protein UreD n=1 Tax=Brevibacterium sp. CFH 10365 TaxID=2585207 RepID=UPI0012667067|nr:urease accessory protein UreD [Brevibacterium sp. CFH 10365]